MDCALRPFALPHRHVSGTIDLNCGAQSELPTSHRHARRRVFPHDGLICPIHLWKGIHVPQVDIDLGNICKSGTASGKDGLYIFEGLCCLPSRAAFNQLHRVGLGTKCSGDKYKVTRNNRMTK